MYLHSFEKLNVWQESIDLVELIYKATNKFPQEENLELLVNDKAHFSTIAFSSTMELLWQIIISKRLSYISEEEYLLLRGKTMKGSNMINALKKSQLNF